MKSGNKNISEYPSGYMFLTGMQKLLIKKVSFIFSFFLQYVSEHKDLQFFALFLNNDLYF